MRLDFQHSQQLMQQPGGGGGGGAGEQFWGKVVIGTTVTPFTDPISGVTFTLTSTQLEISNIPQNFTGIKIKFFGGASVTSQTMIVNFNHDAVGTNYPWGFYQWSTTSPFTNAGAGNGGEFGPLPTGGNYGCNIEFIIYGYASTVWYKKYHSTADSGAVILGFSTTPQRQISTGTWLSLAAVTVIDIGFTSLVAGSTFSVSGIY